MSTLKTAARSLVVVFIVTVVIGHETIGMPLTQDPINANQDLIFELARSSWPTNINRDSIIASDGRPQLQSLVNRQLAPFRGRVTRSDEQTIADPELGKYTDGSHLPLGGIKCGQNGCSWQAFERNPLRRVINELLSELEDDNLTNRQQMGGKRFLRDNDGIVSQKTRIRNSDTDLNGYVVKNQYQGNSLSDRDKRQKCKFTSGVKNPANCEIDSYLNSYDDSMQPWDPVG